MAPKPGSLTRQSSAASFAEEAEEVYEPGTLLWVEDDSKGPLLVKVVKHNGFDLTVQEMETRQEREVDSYSEVFVHNPNVVSDMTALHHIHEPGILHNLRERWSPGKSRANRGKEQQHPYTFMATILISVNPLRRLEDPPMEVYLNKPLDPETPHPYAIAELAYSQMRLHGRKGDSSQSIVVSGESGAGKTETSKIMLRFLASRSSGGIVGLDQRIIESSPILESFGNSKTLRNENSSRFGKFIKLQFTHKTYNLQGAFIDTYLLEKTRVLTQASGERNFHVFYELLAGASPELKKELHLGVADDYTNLSQGGCISIPGVDDAQSFKVLEHAFGTIGLSKETQKQVWRMLAGVLHLASLTFKGKDTSEGKIAQVTDASAMDAVALMLGANQQKLVELLTTKTRTVGAQVFKSGLPVDAAKQNRDACAKAVYQALFQWVVTSINSSLGHTEEALPFIGVLDIFGFENFAQNELEQLLINYTNESLQDTFNHQVFINEIKLYESEGIDVEVSACPDNKATLELLSAKGGVIPMLDNVSNEPNPTDERYCAQLHKAFTDTRHQNFPAPSHKDRRENFLVKHYAGTVKYTVGNWVTRNKDDVPPALMDVCADSTLEVVSSAMSALALAKSSAGRKATVAGGFMNSMKGLNSILMTTACNFVRCIKPNPGMTPGVFDSNYVSEQLKCLGILQTCEVLRVGMPTRLAYSDLLATLGDRTQTARDLFKGQPETALISAILYAYNVPVEAYRLGKTRVFFKAGQISILEKILRDASESNADMILARLKQALADRLEAVKAAKTAVTAKNEADAAVEKVIEVADKATDGAISVLRLGEDDWQLESDEPVSKGSHAMSAAEVESAVEEINRVLRFGSQHTYESRIQAIVDAAKSEGSFELVPGVRERVIERGGQACAASSALAKSIEGLSADLCCVESKERIEILNRIVSAMAELLRDQKALKAAALGAESGAAKCDIEKAKDCADLAKDLNQSISSRGNQIRLDCESVKDSAAALSKALASGTAAAKETERLAQCAITEWESFKVMASSAEEEASAAREALRTREEREREEREKQEALEKQRKQEEEEAAAAAALALKKKQEEVEAAAAAAAKEAEESAAAASSVGLRRPSVRELLACAETDRAGNTLELRKAGLDEAPGVQNTPARNSLGRRASQQLLEELSAKSVPRPAPLNDATTGALSATDFADLNPSRLTWRTLFEKAMADGCKQGHLMKQSKYFSRWRPRYFVLEHGYMEYYEKKSHVGTQKRKTMELLPSSITSYTNTQNCFCVRSGSEMIWFLLAKDEDTMILWMTAINAQIHELYLKTHTVDENDYWGDGVKHRKFYMMVENAQPQWLRCYPAEDAPRTGDGIFPGEVIEICQTLTRGSISYLRMADDRGWTFAKSPTDGSELYREVFGDVVEARQHFPFPPNASDCAVVLSGPHMDCQQTGAIVEPSECPREGVTVSMTFKPAQMGNDIMYLKLADGRGWLAASLTNRTYYVTCGTTIVH